MNKLGTVLLFVAGLLLAFYLGYRVGCLGGISPEGKPQEVAAQHWTLDDLQEHAKKWATEIEISESNEHYKITIDKIIFDYFDTTQSCWEYTANFIGYKKYTGNVSSLNRKLDFRIIMKENRKGEITWNNFDITRNI